MKDIFNVHRLDLQAVASSFCFSNPPKVNLNLDSSASMFRKNTHRVNGIRHGINPRNPYGRQNGGDDTRQFVRHQDIEASPCSSAVILHKFCIFFG